MTSKTSKTKQCAIAASAAAAIFAMAGLVHADDGDGGELLPVAFVAIDEQPGAPESCTDLRERIRFEHELARTDGDVSPFAPQAACRPELYAESTVDAD